MRVGDWHRSALRLAMRGLRLWWREGSWTVVRRVAGKIARQTPSFPAPIAATKPAMILRGPDRIGGASVPTEKKFRVALVGSEKRDFQSMRYRAHHIVEALALAGLEAVFVPDEEMPERLPCILAHDLIVLARLSYSDSVATLIEHARRLGVPLVYDIDDYVFDPWVLPYIESYRECVRSEAVRTMSLRGRCLDLCDYFTGSTPYLAELVSARGKKSFVLRNGLSALQMQLSRQARKRRQTTARSEVVRIGYFSGTRTHQADFRIVYPALMTLLREEKRVRLVVVGHLDLDEFPGLGPFADRIDLRPPCEWRELPAEIAQVDINLIPLELNPFNEGKSNLKYYEAGLLGVPSIASPTQILRASITHGHNGLLAQSSDEWCKGLKDLIARPDLRERLGQNAFEHAVHNYAPEAVAAEVVAIYRHILRTHRVRRGFAENTLSLVVLAHVGEDAVSAALNRANELAAAGHAVTLLACLGGAFHSAAALEQHIARHLFEPLFAVQLGGDVPCCDVLLAGDSHTVAVARANRHRAHLTVSLVPGTPDDTGEYPLPTITETGERLDCILREWVQKEPTAPPARAA